MAYYLNNKNSLENSKGSSSVILIIVCVIVVSAVLLFFFAKNRNTKTLTEQQQLIQEAKETRKNGPAINLTEEEKTDIVESAQTIRQNQDVKVDISEEEMRAIINQSRDIN